MSSLAAAYVRPVPFQWPTVIGTNGDGMISDGAGGADWLNTTSAYTRTIITNAASPYSILISDDIIAVDCSGGAVEVRLPAISTLTNNKKIYRIADETGNAGANNITVKPDSASGDFLTSQTFASGGRIMNTNFESMVIYSDETSTWLIIG